MKSSLSITKNIIMEIIIFFMLLLAFFIFFKKILSTKHPNFLPTPPSLPIIGHLHLIKKPQCRSLAALSNKYGPILSLKFGTRPVLLVSSPSVATDCFTKANDIIFANRPRLLGGKIIGNNYTTLVWASYGPYWCKLRRISTVEILSSKRVQSYCDIRSDEIKSMATRLSDHVCDEYRSVEMKSVFSQLTFNIMMRMITGKVRPEMGKNFIDNVQEAFALNGTSNIGDFLPILRWFGVTKVEKRILSLKKQRDEFIQQLIEDQRKLRKGFRSEGNTKTLIDILLSFQENEPDYYTDEMIRGFT